MELLTESFNLLFFKMKKIIYAISTFLILILSKSQALAFGIPSKYKPSNLPFGFTSRSIESGENAVSGIILILQIIEGSLLFFAGPIAVIMVAYTGLKMIITGNAEGFASGKKSLLWTTLGLVAIILSYSIVRIAITLLLEFGS